jgi:hypothetical protein
MIRIRIEIKSWIRIRTDTSIRIHIIGRNECREFGHLAVKIKQYILFLFEAALGGSIRVQGVYEDLTIQIPPGTPSHTK